MSSQREQSMSSPQTWRRLAKKGHTRSLHFPVPDVQRLEHRLWEEVLAALNNVIWRRGLFFLRFAMFLWSGRTHLLLPLIDQSEQQSLKFLREGLIRTAKSNVSEIRNFWKQITPEHDPAIWKPSPKGFCQAFCQPPCHLVNLSTLHPSI